MFLPDTRGEPKGLRGTQVTHGRHSGDVPERFAVGRGTRVPLSVGRVTNISGSLHSLLHLQDFFEIWTPED